VPAPNAGTRYADWRTVSMNEGPKAAKAWSRKRTTSKRVILSDIVSRWVITAGGVGTIIAVLGVCLFLLWVALPLFRSAEIAETRSFDVSWEGDVPLGLGVDEYQVIGWLLLQNGVLQVFRVETGELLYEERPFGDRAITSAHFMLSEEGAVVGFRDGTIQAAEVGFETAFLEPDRVPGQVRETLQELSVGRGVAYRNGVLQLTPEGQYRLQRLMFEPAESIRLSREPIYRIAHVNRTTGRLFCAVTGTEEDFSLRAVLGREEESFLTGTTTFAFDEPVDLPYRRLGQGAPSHLALSAQGSDLYVAWVDGSLLRIRCADLDDPFIAEAGTLLEGDAELTAFGFVLGNNTLIWGDSRGHVQAGFLVRPEETFDTHYRIHDAQWNEERATYVFAIAKDLGRYGSALVSAASSTRSRLVACGFADGQARLFNVTSEGLLAQLRIPSRRPILDMVIAPKEDGLLAYTSSQLFHAVFDPMHPEANFAALFAPVWYEGYPHPQHMWQSSSATDEFEPKMGLVPLVFGTIKATVYSMLFGAPLALLAAIYSSEFLHPRLKAGIKPTIELMASLPSVVLGFLAALVFAPFVEKVVPATLTGFVTLPVAFLFCAYLWQLLPQKFSLPLVNWRVLFMVIPVALGVLAAIHLGPVIERWLFGGDVRAWLAWNAGPEAEPDSPYRSAVGGWIFLWLPLSGIAGAYLLNRTLNPVMRRLSRQLDRQVLAVIDLGKFILSVALVLFIAWGVSSVLDAAGLDPRGGYIDTYVQRNALVVGMVMGFAIIPIIYTISDDALSTVPDHLRGASLGAGATKWQTAVRIVVPTAMSGLFSALMIGLGRAVGETMIVLMAAGNTPVLSWNIFEGFRTLSANIAVELPEAVKDSTHYRTLFLAALVLFAMTFVVNTLAEVVRLKFRKRATAL